MTHILKLHSVRSGNMIEFLVSRNENQLEGALTRGIHYNWLALPQLEVSCQLANLDDDWNDLLFFLISDDDILDRLEVIYFSKIGIDPHLRSKQPVIF